MLTDKQENGTEKKRTVNVKPAVEEKGGKAWFRGGGGWMRGGDAVWTRSTGDMSHGLPPPGGLVGAVYKRKQKNSGFPRPPSTRLCLIKI